MSARPFHCLKGARDEIAAAFAEEERLADVRLAGVGEQPAVHEEAQTSEERTAQREVTRQPLTRSPIAHGDAEAVTLMVLRVAGHVDAVAAAFGPFVFGSCAE